MVWLIEGSVESGECGLRFKGFIECGLQRF